MISPACTSCVERVEPLRELGVDRLAGVRPLDQDGEIVAALLQRQHEIAVLLQTSAALKDLLGFCLIFPEIWRGGAGLEAGQLIVRACGFKDSSASRSHVS